MALVNSGCDSGLLRLANRNHNAIMFQAMEADDPASREIVDFIRKHGER